MTTNTHTPRFANFVKELESAHKARIEVTSPRGHMQAAIPVPGHPGHVLTVMVEPARTGTLDERLFLAQAWSHRKDASIDGVEPTRLNDGHPLNLAELSDEVGSELKWAAFYESAPPAPTRASLGRQLAA